MQKQQVNPLEAIYATLREEGDPKEAPKESFSFGFVYPSSKFSRINGAEFEGFIEWHDDLKTLVVQTGIRGVSFRPWPGIQPFLKAINTEIQPYLESDGSGHIWAAPWVKSQDEELLGPLFEFRVGCKEVQESLLQRVFQQVLYERAALALWLSRTIFEHVSKHGKEPDALERMRLLCCQHGNFMMNLLNSEDEDGEVLFPALNFPRGFFENLYGRDPTRAH